MSGRGSHVNLTELPSSRVNFALSSYQGGVLYFFILNLLSRREIFMNFSLGPSLYANLGNPL